MKKFRLTVAQYKREFWYLPCKVEKGGEDQNQLALINLKMRLINASIMRINSTFSLMRLIMRTKDLQIQIREFLKRRTLATLATTEHLFACV